MTRDPHPAPAPRIFVAGTLALVLAGCGGGAMMRAQGGHLSSIEDPDPDDFTDKKPVVVLEGRASYYHDSLAGNHTANGDIYDPTRLTAASRDLPFGSIVRVIRRDTGARVLVRVNDRGPFGSKRRILDLSRAAAAVLDMLERGVVDIRAEVLILGDGKRRFRR
ncbi:MAG: septal ring lytic transglycosylase RlpA family protein [Myxococcales bacterium]|jgi:rare lipoprotein A